MIALLLALQSFFASPRLETISYSQFKTLAKKGLLSNVVIGEKLAQLLLEKEVLKTRVAKYSECQDDERGERKSA